MRLARSAHFARMTMFAQFVDEDVRSVEKEFERAMLDVRADLIANALRSLGDGKQRGDATRNKEVVDR